MKEKGILLPIFSLPSKYGIGDFGYEAYEFVDILSENNIKYWEILPINECDKHPYSPVSYYALEEDYISLDKLKEEKLIQNAETRENKDRVIYDNFKDSGYEISFDIEENWYRQDGKLLGNKEFLIQDPDGYLLRFFQDLGEKNI